MSQNFHDTALVVDLGVPRSSRRLAWTARAVAKLRARLALARTRRLVRRLDERQLADAGIDATTILPSRPTFIVEARLMTRLMTLL